MKVNKACLVMKYYFILCFSSHKLNEITFNNNFELLLLV